MPADPDIQPQPAPAIRTLNCPSCGGTVELRAAGYTVHVACQYCGSILDVADPHVKLITQYHEMNLSLEIPLGTRGTLKGVEWEAIGYLSRSENGNYGWEEYLLFNPYQGYRWLVKVRGGWSFGTILTRMPKWRTYDTYSLDDGYYTRFFLGEARVDRVIGEFYWRVAVGETVKTGDWVRPGFMLSREENDREVSWTLNEWLPRREMARAFGIGPELRAWPPLPHEPSKWGEWLGTATKIAVVAALFLVVLAFAFGGSSWTDAGHFPVDAYGKEQSATLGPITFPNRYQYVEISADVPRLEDGWVDLDYTLVNRATQQVYEAYGTAERYSGADTDGPWTEGGRRSQISIASVPAGTYDLIVEYKGNRWSQSGMAFPDGGWMEPTNEPVVHVEVRHGTLYASNILIALLLISLPWLGALLMHLAFEKARKAESDFAPVVEEDE
ncbi:DUF4178 domain-containing protein [Sphingomonas sp. M1-B02]|uniref:DUF4178 domain-containing protein n=1 Tax=Sphingomonas sp. M1-B02 TaxID=3114300 RepID=UPI00223F0D88|nr:DUF4178 domain-containing protein [Sphingomonas sp. S6-11]UZK65419.1 DUF4178 domain-containing protein [Sphingomonas sp. S6-11]